MPLVDLTLEDVRTIVREDVKTIIDATVNTAFNASEERLKAHIEAHIDTRLNETHQATLDLIGTVLDQLDEHSTRFDQMDKRFDRIMELRAAG
jgi:hypothetical protein